MVMAAAEEIVLEIVPEGDVLRVRAGQKIIARCRTRGPGACEIEPCCPLLCSTKQDAICRCGAKLKQS